jgi:adenylosuccinate synthase
MANLIVVGAQWGDEGKGPPATPHGAADRPVYRTYRSGSEGRHD